MSDFVIPMGFLLDLVLMAIVFGLVTYGVFHVYYLMKKENKSKERRHHRTGRKTFVHPWTFPYKTRSKSSKISILPTVSVNQTGWDQTVANPHLVHVNYNESGTFKFPFILTPAFLLSESKKKQSGQEPEEISKNSNNTDVGIDQDYFHDTEMDVPLL